MPFLFINLIYLRLGAIATVQRDTQINRSCSSVILISQTAELLPACSGTPTAVTVPEETLRM